MNKVIKQNKTRKRSRETMIDRFEEFKGKYRHPNDGRTIICTSREHLIELEKEILDYYTTKSSIKHGCSSIEPMGFSNLTYPCLVSFTSYWCNPLKTEYNVTVSVQILIEEPRTILGKLSSIEDYLWTLSENCEHLFSSNSDIRAIAANSIVQALRDSKKMTKEKI